jgi:hypothetical protein
MIRVAALRETLFGLPRALVRTGVARPHATIGFWLAGSLVFALLAFGLKFDTSTSTFLDQSHPAWDVYQQSLIDYGGDEFIVVALDAPTAFHRETLEELRELTRALEGLPGVRRVDSLSTVPLIRNGADGELTLTAALKRGVPEPGAEFEQLLTDLRGDRIAPDSLFSQDEKTFAINVMLDEDVIGDRTQVVNAIEKLLESRTARATGVPLFRTAVNSRTYREVLIFVPLTLLLVAVVVTLAFSSTRPVMIPLAVGSTGSLMVVGVMSVTGVSLSLSTMILPSILLALGCAYSMHILTAAVGHTGPRALRDALEEVAKPVALSGLTTAIGFGAMATVSIIAIEQLALLGALGVITLTASALSLAPAMVTLRPILNRSSVFSQLIRARLLPSVLISADRYRNRSLLVWCLLLGTMTVGVFALRVSTDIIVWFPKGTEIRDDYEVVRHQLSGISPVNVVIKAQSNRPVTDPEAIRVIDELSDWIEAQPEVGKTLAVSDPLRQLHRVLNEGEVNGLPDTEAMVDQYLLLLESVDYMQDVITHDRTGANILVRVDDNGSDRLVALGERIGRWWAQHGPSDFSVETTGVMYEFGRSEEQIAYGQATGLSLALLSIGAVLLFILRAPRNALVALVPNAVPLVIAFGLMGILGIPLDAATVCLGSLALGIAVDDTIHVMTGYTDRRKSGDKPLQALERCMTQVLPALVFTTVAITAGFLVLALSEFTLIRNLGFVTSGLVFLCLLADMTLLPPLLLAADRKSL